MTCISPGQNVTYYYYYLHCVECIAWNVGYCCRRPDVARVAWSVCVSVCWAVTPVGPVKTDEAVEMPFKGADSPGPDEQCVTLCAIKRS